jgi:thiol:disulfide interchange protein DsbA
MNRLATSFATLVTVISLTVITTSSSYAETFQEGQHYLPITPAQPTSTKDKVEVVEMFWYGCPHCYRLEPFVKRWLKKMPKNAKFVRMPGVLNPSWEILARAYYTAEILGVVDKVHTPIFETIHEKRHRLDSEDAIMALFKQYGVSETDFKRTFRSFAVETKIRRARDMGRRYQANGVPAIIVNGKYRVNATTAGGNAKVFKVVNQLIKQESKK